MIDINEILDKCPICGKDIIISYKQVNFACSDKNCSLGHGVTGILPAMKDICVILNKIWDIKIFMQEGINK